MDCDEFITEMARLGIKMDFSSAKHPAGNLHAENAVKRLRRAMAHCYFSDTYEQIWALNMSEPYDKTRLTPFEALHVMVIPVSGVPLRNSVKKYLVDRTWLKKKKEN